MGGKGRVYIWFLLFAIIVALLPPLVGDVYYINVLVFVGIHAIIVLGLNMLMGYAGQISLGHAAFYGLGAYISGILSTKYGLYPWFSFVIAVVLTGGLAFLIGRPILKLKGHYLAMATLGLGIIINKIFIQMSDLTGGTSGLIGIPYLTLGSFALDNDLRYYYLVWGIAVLLLILSWNVIDSRVGRALRAIHGSELAASALGIDISKHKVQVFVLSAVYAALAGALYAHFITFLSPAAFDFHLSIGLVTMVVIGGMASIGGSIFGAAALTILPQYLMVFEDYDILIYGLILVLIMIFMPQGLTRGVVDLVKRRIIKL